MTIEELYQETISHLPAGERLQLARLILNGIAPESVADFSDEWSDADLRDFAHSGWARAQAEEDA